MANGCTDIPTITRAGGMYCEKHHAEACDFVDALANLTSKDPEFVQDMKDIKAGTYDWSKLEYKEFRFSEKI